MFDWLSLFVGTAIGAPIGAFLSTLHNFYVTRPKLKCTGCGGNGGIYKTCYVEIGNPPGLLGLSIAETKILGRSILRDKKYGLDIPRSTATECTAFIKEVGGEGRACPLTWKAKGSAGTWSMTASIGCEDRVSLMLFSGEAANPELFSFFVPASNSTTNIAPKLPPPHARFRAPAKFEVTVCSGGRTIFFFPVDMRRGINGELYYATPVGGGSF